MRHDFTVDEIIQKINELESSLLSTIKAFEDNTDLSIIEIDLIEAFTVGNPVRVKCTVDIFGGVA